MKKLFLTTRKCSVTSNLQPHTQACSFAKSSTQGFTLLEQLVVVVVIGIFSAIAAPGWAGFIHAIQLSKAQDQVYWAIRTAQEQAKQKNDLLEIGFRNANDSIEWAVYPAATINLNAVSWRSLGKNVQIDSTATSMRLSQNVYRTQFDYRGHVNGQLGKLTIKGIHNEPARRCVFVSTLIGGIRRSNQC